MVGRIKHITNLERSVYDAGTFAEFIHWLDAQKTFQFDIETNVTKWWPDFKIISMQFGSCTPDRVQWFLQWSMLTPIQRNIIKKYLEDRTRCKLIHNAVFEYVVCRFHGIIIENVYDTMVVEKILMGGMELEDYALADISYKYLRIIMDKTLQMSFGDNIMTDAKIVYGITDVAYLDVIRSIQMMDAQIKDVVNVVALENDAVLAFADITYEGMLLDKEKWRENERMAWPVVFEAKAKIDGWLTKEPFRSFALEKGYISDQDRHQINYNSFQQKADLLRLVFPDIPGASKGVVQAYLRDRGPTLDPVHMGILMDVLEKNNDSLSAYILEHHRDYLLEQEYLIPAGKVTINWNSQPQVLPLMQLVEPRLKGLGEDERNKCVHPALKDLEAYKQALKLVTDLGEEWINKYVGPDGKARTNFNQIVSTGRCSSANPNMQNITVDEKVGTRYRNAFVCEPGWVFVDSDYISQELVIIAYISKDPVWMEAIDRGWDLHSIVAETMYGKKWKDGTEEDCLFYNAMYYNKTTNSWLKPLDYERQIAAGMPTDHWKRLGPKEKCNCKKHKQMRYDCKTISFGLAYGMSEFKLASTLEISVKEAMVLMKWYFAAFPKIGKTLEFLGHFGLQNGYIMTLAPFFRKRWFPYWREWKDYVEPHIMGIKYVPTLGEIERASKNQPIQGSSADITKAAMVLVREYIRDNNLWNTVKLCAQVHDQVTTICKYEFSETWKAQFDKLMRDAAQIVIPTGILKADTNITPVWTK